MQKILLTQSQVSVFVSSSVVFVFTFVLFLSGYILQQRSVTGLQEALKPRAPAPPPALSVQNHGYNAESELPPRRLFRGSDGQMISYTNVEAAKAASRSVDWSRLAHVQLAHSHHEVCNAIMVLAELHKLRSPARRVLLFPEEWALEKEGNKKGEFFEDPFMASTRRLLRMAARRYRVELRPISLIVKQDESHEGIYSLASAFALTEFDRLLNIGTPGIVLAATPLDAILAFTETVPFAMLHDSTDSDGVHSHDLQLLQPSTQTHLELFDRVAQESHFNDTLLPTMFNEPLMLASSSEDGTFIRSIGTLHGAAHDFNQTAYLSDVAYIRFSDPKLPGPEYDVPWSQKVAARPKRKEADWVWTKLYGQFAQKRMEVCGLDLETWRG